MRRPQDREYGRCDQQHGPASADTMRFEAADLGTHEALFGRAQCAPRWFEQHEQVPSGQVGRGQRCTLFAWWPRVRVVSSSGDATRRDYSTQSKPQFSQWYSSFSGGGTRLRLCGLASSSPVGLPLASQPH